MPESPSDPQARLRDEILADARRQAERVLRRGRKEAETLLAHAREAAERERAQAMERAGAEAIRRRDVILATVPVETARLEAARLEELLVSIRDDAAARLAEGGEGDRRAALVRLAGAAILRMDGDAFSVEIPAADLEAFGAGLADDMARASGREAVRVRLAAQAVPASSGVIVRDPDGRQVWDNTLPARLRRNWPGLRLAAAAHAGLVVKDSAGGSVA